MNNDMSTLELETLMAEYSSKIAKLETELRDVVRAHSMVLDAERIQEVRARLLQNHD